MKKTQKLVDKLVEEIEKTPLVHVACDKVGISRNTFYRWMKEDKKFLERINESMSLGSGFVSDVALSNVLSGIKNKDAMYTKYWLSHKHPDFRRPFVHKVDSDDLLAQFRSVLEGLKKREIEEGIRYGETSYNVRMKEAEEKIIRFNDRWQKTIESSRHKEARKLFEEWKKEELDKKDNEK